MRLDLVNALALLLTLAISMAGAALSAHTPPRSRAERARSQAGSTRELLDGRPVLRDASGTLVPLVHYTRIASATLVADRALADLCEPERIVAFTRYAAATPYGHRLAGKATIAARGGVEQMLALKPDLVLTSELVDADYAARLRERGVQVFDLGPMHGLATLAPSIAAIGELVGAPERARLYVESLRARLSRVAATVTTRARPRALYLARYGDRLFGAAAETSYHDLFVYAWLRDVAAEAGLRGWPELSSEQVLTLAPELLVTRRGMSASVCRHPGLERLPACGRGGRVVELDGALLDDPGPGMLEATEALFVAVWAP